MKTAFLIAITSGQRGQAIHAMNLDYVSKLEDQFIFSFPGILKESKVGKHNTPLIVNKCKDEEICPFAALDYYLKTTESLRTSNAVWVSIRKPHKALTKPSLSRYIKDMLQKAGIEKYGPHSTRHAATSKAHKSVGLQTIIRTASWASGTNFKRFYLRPCEEEEEQPARAFSTAVLSA